MTALHGVDVRVELHRPDVHFHLDHDVLDVDVLGAPPAWAEVSCDVAELSCQRGDVLEVDQRPNAKLEPGTLTVTVLDREGVWLPDDLARLLGLPLTGLHPGTGLRVIATVPGVAAPCPVFVGTVTDYDGEWLEDGTHLITVSAVDAVATVANVNPAALPAPVGDRDWWYQRFDRLAALTPVVCLTDVRYGEDWSFRGDTFADPLIQLWQQWGDTALHHLAMRHTDTLEALLYVKAVARDPGGASTPYSFAWDLTDCLLDPVAPAIPLHWGRLVVSVAGIVNDVLASADRSGTDRYDMKFSVYPGTGYQGWGKAEVMTSDGGTTWGALVGDQDRTGTVDHGAEWDALPSDGSADVQAVVLGVDGLPTGRSWKWNVQGPTTDRTGAHWLTGLMAVDGSDYPMAGEVLRVTFTRTNRPAPEDASAVRAVAEQSRAAYGLQDYRRLDLPFAQETADATAWANEVLRVASAATTYIGEAEVHVHLPNGPLGLQVDLLDRLTVRKQFPEYGNTTITYQADVIGVDDELDTVTWVRRFHLAPVGVPTVEARHGA